MSPHPLTELFSAIVTLSWRAGWLIVVLAALRLAVRGRVPAQVWFVAWILVALRLLLPFSVPAGWSPYNLWPAKSPAAAATPRVEPPPLPLRLESLPAAIEPVVEIIQPAGAVSSAAPVAAPMTATIERKPASWTTMEILTAVWLMGIAGLAMARAAGSWTFRRRLRHARPVTDERIAALIEQESGYPTVGSRVILVETDAVDAPALYGLVHPRLLLPVGLAAKLTEGELRHVVRHELGHWRRRDLLAQALMQAAVALHWFNPLAWLAAWLAQADCELACDEFVLRRESPSGATAYGATLLKVLSVARGRRRPLAVVAMLEGREQLAQRIRMIAGYRTSTMGRVLAGVTLIAALTAASLTRESRAEERSTTPVAATVSPAAQKSVAATAPAFAPTSNRSLAVLPLTSFGADKDDEVFTDGLHAELITALSRTPDLRVVSRESTLPFKGTSAQIGETARKLGVAYVVVGSVRRSGARLRAQFELRRASDEQTLWSESFDRELKDVFQVQSEIASALTRAVRAAMAPRATATTGTLVLGNGTLTISGNDPSPGVATTLTKTGTGTLILTPNNLSLSDAWPGAQRYTGTTTVSGATLTLSGNNPSPSAAATTTKTGTGTLTLSGDNSYTGTTTISAGTLTISPTAPAAKDEASTTTDAEKRARIDKAMRTFSMLKQPLDDQRRKVEQLQQLLQAYKEKTGVGLSLDTRKDIVNETLKAINQQATRSSQLLNVAEVRLKQVKERRERGGDLTELSFIGTQFNVAQLITRRAEQQIRVETLNKRLGPQHPDMLEAHSMLTSIEHELQKAIDNASAQVEADYQAAVRQSEQVKTDLAKQTQESLNLDRLALDYLRLERELKTNEELLQRIATQSQEAALQASTNFELTAGPDSKSEILGSKYAGTSASREFTISVMGAVNQQGGIVFSEKDKPIMLDAIARSGGFAGRADRNAVRVIRQNPDGSRSTHTLTESELMSGADQIGVLQRGDIVVVPEKPEPAASGHISVLGQVAHPGNIDLVPGKTFTVTDAIALAGGPTRLANLKKVLLKHADKQGQASKVITIDVDGFFKGSNVPEANIALESGDIIMVPERTL